MNKPFTEVKNVFLNYWGIWFVLGVLSIFIIIKILGDIPLVEEEREVLETVKIPSFGSREYVGSKRCRDCHWREYDTWKVTLHSKFIQPPNELSVIGDFERNNKLTVKVTDKAPKLAGREITTAMYKKDGKYYVNTIGPDWEFHDYEITKVIGLGERQNFITKFPNGAMHVLPIEWDAKTGKWVDNYGVGIHYPGEGNYWSDSGRIWQFKCGSCHVTGMKTNYNKAKNSFDSTWTDLGIACEACHGPGSNHVEAASVYFEDEKETIINPARLPWRLRAMVCGQCHNWGESTTEVSPYNEGFPDRYSYASGYMAGKWLPIYFVEAKEEEKKHHQQYNEWKKSEHSKAGIMCTNCHEVHQEKLALSQTRLAADNLCLSCHKTLQRRAAHRIHTFGSCVACHMPRTIGHEHSHTFQFISPELSIRAGGVDKQPNSCSSCHHHKDTPLETLVEFLDAAKKEDMPKPFTAHGK